jgi:hypothetical protein
MGGFGGVVGRDWREWDCEGKVGRSVYWIDLDGFPCLGKNGERLASDWMGDFCPGWNLCLALFFSFLNLLLVLVDRCVPSDDGNNRGFRCRLIVLLFPSNLA